MRTSKTKSRLTSALFGAFFGMVLVIAASYTSFTPKAWADETGGWCPDTFEGTSLCTRGYCFKPTVGSERCIYWVNGNCNGAEHACTAIPESD